jgi:ketosteroid isomerase-like protein
MNILKSISTIFLITLFIISCNQTPKPEAIPVVDVAAEKEAVKTVLKSYKDAIQALNAEATLNLFSQDSQVFESGGSEGTYTNYLEHHLGPELHHFNSFVFSDYKVSVLVDLPYAFTTETYIYSIDLKANEEKGREAQIINKKGVATSVLRKTDGAWKIMKTHSSSRANRNSGH